MTLPARLSCRGRTTTVPIFHLLTLRSSRIPSGYDDKRLGSLADLPADWQALRDPQAEALMSAWHEQVSELEKREHYKDFLIYLKHRWFPLVVTRAERTEYVTALRAADVRDLGPLVRLYVRTEILFSLHGVGHGDTGAYACTAMIYTRSKGEQGVTVLSNVEPLADEPFSFTYREIPNAVSKRFGPWANTCLVRGLQQLGQLT